jgi:hypothetical protein
MLRTSRTVSLIRFCSTLVLMCIMNLDAMAQTSLVRKPANASPSSYSSANVSVCQPAAAASDFQIRHYVPGMIQGYFRFEWTLYKDGNPYQSFNTTYDLRGGNALGYQNHTYQNAFFNLPTDAGTYSGGLVVRKRKGVPGFWNYNEITINASTPALTIANSTPTHDLKIRNSNGVFVGPAPNGAPIKVSLSGGIIIDASAGNCETGYLIIVQESNLYWTRSMNNEMDKWLTGQAPAALNLQQTVTTYSASDGTGYFSLLGGNFTTGPLSGQQRYYRVGIQAAGAPWAPKMALIQVEW